jgi:hypothetical protein
MDSPGDTYTDVSVRPDDRDRCTVCGTPADDKYNGQYWCDRHLQQRMAREY